MGCTVCARLARYSRRVNSQIPVETTHEQFNICARVHGGDSEEMRFTECALRIRFAAGPRVSAKRSRVHRRRTANSDFPTASGVRPYAFSHGTRGRANCRSRHVAGLSSAWTAGVPAAERSSDSLRGGARINVVARRDSDAPLMSRARGRVRPPLSRARH